MDRTSVTVPADRVPALVDDHGFPLRPPPLLDDHEQLVLLLDDHEQLVLPFLTADQVATIDQAREAIDRATGNAVAAHRTIEAIELARLGAQLAEILDQNAGAVRSARR